VFDSFFDELTKVAEDVGFSGDSLPSEPNQDVGAYVDPEERKRRLKRALAIMGAVVAGGGVGALHGHFSGLRTALPVRELLAAEQSQLAGRLGSKVRRFFNPGLKGQLEHNLASQTALGEHAAEEAKKQMIGGGIIGAVGAGTLAGLLTRKQD
jgi:hypothetical protein